MLHFLFLSHLPGYSRLQVFPLVWGKTHILIKSALLLTQASSKVIPGLLLPPAPSQDPKRFLVTSYFIPQSDFLLSMEGGDSYFRSTICPSALPWPQTCAPHPFSYPLGLPEHQGLGSPWVRKEGLDRYRVFKGALFSAQHPVLPAD